MFLALDAGPPPLRPEDSRIRHNDWAVLARHWFPVATSKSLGDDPFAARLLDVDIVLFRSENGITAARDMCPHRWVKLSAGRVEDGKVVCPFHGLTFDGSGQCVRVPALGRDAKLPSSYRVQTFKVEERYGMIWLLLDPTSDEPLPVFSILEGYHDSALMFAAVWDWPMSAARQIENFFDLAHLPLVHASTLGGDPYARINPAKIENRERSLLFTASFVETVPFEQPTRCDLSYEVFMPFAIQFSSTPEGLKGFASLNIATPISAHTTRVFQVMARGEPGDVFEEDEWSVPATDGPGIINQQDIDVLETLQISDLPLTEKLEIHLPVDNVSSAYRKRLREMGLGR